MKLPIYLDYAATTPLDPRVVEKMLPFLSAHFGNAATLAHAYGRAARAAIDDARQQVAALIGAEPQEIIWTSGATEAINLALKGAAQLYQRRGKHIITWQTEHKAVLETCEQLEKNGFSLTYLPLLTNGHVDLEIFQQALRNDTVLVSLMHVNNETGVIQDIDAIAQLTAARDILFHVDAAQSQGKILLDVRKTPLDLMTLSAHKIYGPKGLGALYVRRKPRVRVAAQMHGGGHEQGMRSGTLPTHQIVGMGEAFCLARAELLADQEKIFRLRERFLAKITQLKNYFLNGNPASCYPGIVNIGFPGIKAEKLFAVLPDIAFAAGSACTASSIEPSYVLRALGLNTAQAASAVRFSFGRFTTPAEIDFAGDAIVKAVVALQSIK